MLHDDPSDAEIALEEGASTLHGQVVGKLRGLLLSGELPSGARISEADLCRRFSVSRTPLREALKVLAAEGFIELRPNRGSVVAPIDPVEIAHVFEFKGAIERQIGLLSVVRSRAEDRARLERVHADLGAAETHRNPVAYTGLNQEFHHCLAKAAGNPVLLQTYDNLQKRILRLRFAVNQNLDRLDQSFIEHEGIMVAFRAGARLDLAERLEEHNRLTGEAVLKALRDQDAGRSGV
ncbi:GntR family transcriptional regulator [Flaviflagellibacter deserti]|uniref:GntR family transcriptional regulator n=1 Tax=Flaviflagellibacter deserti TaxID=2267266 RepID=A0ABV9Z3X4_9HYPH